MEGEEDEEERREVKACGECVNLSWARNSGQICVGPAGRRIATGRQTEEWDGFHVGTEREVWFRIT